MRPTFLFSALIFVCSVGALRAQTTGPLIKSDSHAKSDSAKKNTMTLRTIHMSPVAVPMPGVDNAGIDSAQQFPGSRPVSLALLDTREIHLSNIHQLTSSGINTEPRVSPDDRLVTFEGRGLFADRCDQSYVMDLNGEHVRRISTGIGKTSSASFLGASGKIIYASTQAGFGGKCPAVDSNTDLLWPLYPELDLYLADTNGGSASRVTQDDKYYDGEVSVSRHGHILFTSTRSGDIDLYSLDTSRGSTPKQLTHDIGYEGQASFSPDDRRIAFLASHPTKAEMPTYKAFLAKGYLKPLTTEIYVMDADGSNAKQLTHNNAINSAPTWDPSGKYIVYASNAADPASDKFDLYRISVSGSSEPERLTFTGINFYPVFTNDGKHLLFSSNRGTVVPNGMNIFIADWKE